ncbi:unnamed protein product [Citrullus colocynthis]|uniref:Uncharacterized protein n=1 Tax=Citrullus colocynthis TaxID=252529 RepID=A0ABP0Y5P6_9ROSI
MALRWKLGEMLTNWKCHHSIKRGIKQFHHMEDKTKLLRKNHLPLQKFPLARQDDLENGIKWTFHNQSRTPDLASEAKNTLIWRFRGESVQGKSSSLSGILTYASATLETNYSSEIFGSLSPPAGALHVKTHHLFHHLLICFIVLGTVAVFLADSFGTALPSSL